jgi:arylsulfatase
MASVFGPRTPWVVGSPNIADWNPDDDPWELYDLSTDYSQAHDIAADDPDKVRQMRDLFRTVAEENHVLPIGAAYQLFLHPEDRRPAMPGRTEFTYRGGQTRISEFFAPAIGGRSARITVDASVSPNASGVLFALGGVAGGITLYLDRGRLHYEYNTLGMWRSKVDSNAPIPTGDVQIVIEMRLRDRPGGPADVVVSVGGTELGRTEVPVTVPLSFSATETLDVGTDLGSPVALEYYDRAPFAFEGTVQRVHIEYL